MESPSLIAISAAEGGHRELVIDMIRRGANNYDGIAASAAIGNQMEIVGNMFKRGATNFQEITDIIASKGATPQD